MGDLVIVNELDRPCSRLIAVVLDDESMNGLSGLIRASYIAKEFASRSPMVLPTSRMTRVDSFGVDIRRDGGSCFSVEASPSEALYPDGSVRAWQEDGGFGRRVEVSALGILAVELWQRRKRPAFVELLEACEDAVRFMDEHRMAGGLTYETLQAAIKKARGEE